MLSDSPSERNEARDVPPRLLILPETLVFAGTVLRPGAFLSNGCERGDLFCVTATPVVGFSLDVDDFCNELVEPVDLTELMLDLDALSRTFLSDPALVRLTFEAEESVLGLLLVVRGVLTLPVVPVLLILDTEEEVDSVRFLSSSLMSNDPESPLVVLCRDAFLVASTLLFNLVGVDLPLLGTLLLCRNNELPVGLGDLLLFDSEEGVLVDRDKLDAGFATPGFARLFKLRGFLTSGPVLDLIG